MKVFILTEEGNGFTDEGLKLIADMIASKHSEIDTSNIEFVGLMTDTE